MKYTVNWKNSFSYLLQWRDYKSKLQYMYISSIYYSVWVPCFIISWNVFSKLCSTKHDVLQSCLLWFQSLPRVCVGMSLSLSVSRVFGVQAIENVDFKAIGSAELVQDAEVLLNLYTPGEPIMLEVKVRKWYLTESIGISTGRLHGLLESWFVGPSVRRLATVVWSRVLPPPPAA